MVRSIELKPLLRYSNVLIYMQIFAIIIKAMAKRGVMRGAKPRHKFRSLRVLFEGLGLKAIPVNEQRII